jgi:dynein assembly factor 3, axonemal
MFWGFSESLNLHEEFCKQFPNTPPVELNILLYGSGDPRHILQTLAKSYDHQTQLNFFYIEGCIEIQARNLLLLSIAMEQREEISIKTKTHLFMDVYGNSLVRPSSAHYAYAKSEILKKVITDGDYAVKIAPIFNFDNLKYRERDQLETAFEFWKDKVDYKFEIVKLWDMQLRSGLGARYDHRNGAFDWDLHMKLKDQGAERICTQEYKQWRETGEIIFFYFISHFNDLLFYRNCLHLSRIRTDKA